MPPDGKDKDLKKMTQGGNWKGKEKEVVVANDASDKKLWKEEASDKDKDVKDADSIAGGGSSASVHSEVPPAYGDAVRSDHNKL